MPPPKGTTVIRFCNRLFLLLESFKKHPCTFKKKNSRLLLKAGESLFISINHNWVFIRAHEEGENISVHLCACHFCPRSQPAVALPFPGFKGKEAFAFQPGVVVYICTRLIKYFTSPPSPWELLSYGRTALANRGCNRSRVLAANFLFIYVYVLSLPSFKKNNLLSAIGQICLVSQGSGYEPSTISSPSVSLRPGKVP
ncbi:hypothetical protein KIL84_009364 [Mauremys mutica]|uniref:Uncharacterized protein n=1 Tax=Mauremys mutica TaxID=74926 RepID=A0A9D3XII9_9SAUR|nr:hypothetical protein KIL84_009364 [Mauremys mutica]